MITTTNRYGGTEYVYNDGFDEHHGLGRRSFESILCPNCRLAGPYVRYGDIVKEWSRSYEVETEVELDNGRLDYRSDTVEEDCATTEMHYTCPRCNSEWTVEEDECD